MRGLLERCWRQPPQPHRSSQQQWSALKTQALIELLSGQTLGALPNHLLGDRKDPLTICVDGVTWGGAGKTQVVEHLARAWSVRGARVSVLCHGYRAQGRWREPISLPTSLSQGDLRFGDEAAMLRLTLPTHCQIWVGGTWRSRWESAARSGAEVVISDGGLYHISRRHLGVIVAPAQLRPRLTPWGDLTRPLQCLPRGSDYLYWWVDHRIAREDNDQIIEGDVTPERTPERALTPLLGLRGTPEVISRVYPRAWLNSVGEERPLSARWIEPVGALSAIARPERFDEALSALGVNIMKRVRLKDHAEITPEVLDRLTHTPLWLTTMKDLVKLPELMLRRRAINLWALRVSITVPIPLQTREKLNDT